MEMKQNLDEIMAARAERREAIERENALARAIRLREQAEEWPRCGQRWPMDRAERAADRLLREAGIEVPR